MSYLKELEESLRHNAAQVQDIRKEWKGKEGVMPADVEEKLDKALEDYDQITAKMEREHKAQAAEKSLSRIVEPVLMGMDDKQTTKGDVGSTFSLALKAMNNLPLTDVERKAVQADDWGGGGVLTAPADFVNAVIQNVDDQVFMRQLATVYQTNGNGLGLPTLVTDSDDADWTSELGQSATTELAFGKRELKPIELKKAILISKKLLLNSSINFESYVQERIAWAFARPQEKAFLTGTGAGQPLGVFTASDDGISTARNEAAGSQTAFVGNDFINALFKLKAQYQARATWIMHRDLVKILRKLKNTTTNEYIWQPLGQAGMSLIPGAPGELVGRPVIMSEYAPKTYTTALPAAVVGDFSYYWIADGMNLGVQVLNELYSRTSQVGYHVESAHDGMPVLEEAFTRLVMAP